MAPWSDLRIAPRWRTFYGIVGAIALFAGFLNPDDYRPSVAPAEIVTSAVALAMLAVGVLAGWHTGRYLAARHGLPAVGTPIPAAEDHVA